MTRELLREATMSADGAGKSALVVEADFIPMDELIRRMDRPPMTYAEAVAAGPGGFETDEELDGFLVWYRAERQRFVG